MLHVHLCTILQVFPFHELKLLRLWICLLESFTDTVICLPNGAHHFKFPALVDETSPLPTNLRHHQSFRSFPWGLYWNRKEQEQVQRGRQGSKRKYTQGLRSPRREREVEIRGLTVPCAGRPVSTLVCSNPRSLPLCPGDWVFSIKAVPEWFWKYPWSEPTALDHQAISSVPFEGSQ